jgi:hypothetical protein
METNRTHPISNARLEAEIFGSGGDTDSIVDRLFAMPPAAAGTHGEALWQVGVARRLERVLAERIRARIEARAPRPDAERVNRV